MNDHSSRNSSIYCEVNVCSSIHAACSEWTECSSTIYELVSHQLMHSDYKQFCCGLCGRYFKRKETCKTLFSEMF